MRGDGLGVPAGSRREMPALKFAAQVLGLRFVAMDPSHVVGGPPSLLGDIDAALIVADPAVTDPPTGAVLLDEFVSTSDSTEPVAVQAKDDDIAQLVHTGGVPLLPSRHQEAIDRFGPIVAQAHGQFESFAITYADHGDAANHLTSVGRPVPCVELKIVDEVGGIGHDERPLGPSRPRRGWRTATCTSRAARPR